METTTPTRSYHSTPSGEVEVTDFGTFTTTALRAGLTTTVSFRGGPEGDHLLVTLRGATTVVTHHDGLGHSIVVTHEDGTTTVVNIHP